ncbi:MULTISPECIES: polyhydroxyalkanoic acid system family protein [Giesbergeria]|uniref:Polyhydroxyalkanoic acid system family protein n=1 Tax=Giesbergeria sinuosa TaxID=80883 RepID=A0ABV9QDY3_9BURK
MSAIHIHRHHQLGLPQAREIARQWAHKAERKFDLRCHYLNGDTQDTVRFERSGIQGTLQVRADQFELAAQLGFLFSAFAPRIEAEIAAQIDSLLQAQIHHRH